MTELLQPRRYSLGEIDTMRQAVRHLYLEAPGHLWLGRDHERAAYIEEQLRTHMMNGTAPEEIAAQAFELSWCFRQWVVEAIFGRDRP